MISQPAGHARSEVKEITNPTILSHTLRTYFFSSIPSRTTPTTACIPLINSRMWALSELTISTSLHGDLAICANGRSNVNSSSRRIASIAAERVEVKSSFSASRVTADLKSEWIVWRRCSSSYRRKECNQYLLSSNIRKLEGRASRYYTPEMMYHGNTLRC